MEIVKAFNAAKKDPILEIKYSNQRNISEEIKNDYLSKFDNLDDKEFVEKILEDTIYVPENIFLKELYNSFDNFSETIQNKPYYIFLPEDKFSSEHIFTIYLWDKIINTNFIKFVSSSSMIIENVDVLIIDDCIYTGNNTLSAIDELTYNNKNKNINFHIVVPYISHWGKLQIETFKVRSQIFTVQFYNTQKIINFFAYPRNQKYQKLVEKFELDFDQQVPIYFDHKVANNFSTFSSIYLNGVIPGKENYGILINYYPDTDVKTRIYNKYFIGLNLIKE